MRSTKSALAVLCAAVLVACDGADSLHRADRKRESDSDRDGVLARHSSARPVRTVW